MNVSRGKKRLRHEAQTTKTNATWWHAPCLPIATVGCGSGNGGGTAVTTTTTDETWNISSSHCGQCSSSETLSPYPALVAPVLVPKSCQNRLPRVLGDGGGNETSDCETYDIRYRITLPDGTHYDKQVPAEQSMPMILWGMLKKTGQIHWAMFDALESTPPQWWSADPKGRNPWALEQERFHSEKANVGIGKRVKPMIGTNPFTLVVKKRKRKHRFLMTPKFKSPCTVLVGCNNDGGSADNDRTQGAKAILIDDAYMGEVIHNCLLSTLFERGISPHFPLYSMAFVNPSTSEYTQAMEYCGWPLDAPDCLVDSSLYNIRKQCNRVASLLNREPIEVLAETINQTIPQVCAALAACDREFGCVHHDCIPKNIFFIPLMEQAGADMASFRGYPMSHYKRWIYVIDQAGGHDGEKEREGETNKKRRRIIAMDRPHFLVKIADPEYASCSDAEGPNGCSIQIVLRNQYDGAYSEDGISSGLPQSEAKGYDIHHILIALVRLATKNQIMDLTLLPELYRLRRGWKINPKTQRPYTGHVNNCTPREMLMSKAFDGWEITEEEFSQIQQHQQEQGVVIMIV